jgi:protein-disulfide isomerase
LKMCQVLEPRKHLARLALCASIAACSVGASYAQTPATGTSAGAPSATGSKSAQTPEPQAPAPHAPPASPFPAVNLKNFTADYPTTALVDSFLKAEWGYDPNRIWSVAAIQKTPAPGVSRVVVFVADKTKPTKLSDEVLYITPDGKHAIAGAVVSFGANPFAETRKTLQEQANGPAEGAANGDLLLVEFSDLLNPKAREAQTNINNLLKEIPQARLVFENLPAEGSQYAMLAATEGVCVRKAKGEAAFFTYMNYVFSKQQGLTPATLQPMLNAAVTAAGADPKSVDTCAATPAAKADVKASIALGSSVGIEQAPELVINGRIIPPASAPYDLLKQIVAYQAKMDGVTVHVQPTLTTVQ